ncbi:MAG: type I-U CRISPR-associated protein Cas5/Cas6 [Labilithrix sp.]|nr:type I-U CRISPR-associated protein Cas5/Cas6 [Labilithrix sp.]
MLALEIELLTGVYRASLPDGSRAEWPPHPERIFSALVQAWGDGGRRDDERAALEWLEALPPPIVRADDVPHAATRDAWTVYVPPNDPRGDELTVMPDRRRRQPRVFHAAVPAVLPNGSAHVHLGWSDEPSPTTLEALHALTHRVASLGHSSSLARLRFQREADARPVSGGAREWHPDPTGPIALRMPYRGRLADLERWSSRAEGKQVERPRSLRTERYRARRTANDRPEESVFGDADDWFVFEGLAGTSDFEPDILGLAHVTSRLREALLAAAGDDAPELLSGHAQPNVPSVRPHIAIVPLLNVGWEYATGDLLGLAVCLPRRISTDERRAVLGALARFSAPPAEDPEAPPCGELRFRHGTWVLERTAAPSRHSLRPNRYCTTSKEWASVTPLQLDRFPGRGDVLEEARIVAAACEHVGLPPPSSIELHKHSAIRGAPSAYPGRGVRHRPEWSFPQGSKIKDRPRRHVVLSFDREVRGPLLLGAGRYQGFGLCLPIDSQRQPEATNGRRSPRA